MRRLADARDGARATPCIGAVDDAHPANARAACMSRFLDPASRRQSVAMHGRRRQTEDAREARRAANVERVRAFNALQVRLDETRRETRARRDAR